MDQEKVLLDPQPSEGMRIAHRLEEGAWRFVGKDMYGQQLVMDVPVPEELERSSYRVTPVQDTDGWFWGVVQTAPHRVRP